MHSQFCIVHKCLFCKSFLPNAVIRKHFFRSYTLGNKSEVTAKFSNGISLVLETGQNARMADGSVLATMGNTSVLVTAVGKAANIAAVGQSFVPLTVDYRQKHAAAGRIPNNYLKREMGHSEQEILTSRVIDRSLRPLFPDGFTDETQLSCNLMAVDGVYSPDVVSINAASAALAVSSIPWTGPVGAVRVGYCDDEMLINPTRRELQHSAIDLVVASAPKKLVVMLEGGCNNVHLPKLQKAIKVGVKESQIVVQAIQKLADMAGKPKRDFVKHVISEEIQQAVQKHCSEALMTVFTNYSYDKQSRDMAVAEIRKQILVEMGSEFEGKERDLEAAFQQLSKKIFRQLILDTGVRCDGRSCTHMRDLYCASDVYPALHGSSLFQRGQTQVQCTVAYDSLHYASSINPLLQATGGGKDRNFLLHYTFPSYATNELNRPGAGALSRREVGHGALAERALRPLMPQDLPYAVLLAATVQESNGSSSMGTVCGGSMALYDAGVKLVAPAAGIAMGLVTEVDANGTISRHSVLTDILGIEDYLGDMDFKIAGTRTGITALQADVKLPGLPLSIIMEALQQATAPRVQVLDVMADEIPEPRKTKDTWPVVTAIEVPASRRAKLMGPGGTTLKKLQAQTGVEIWFEDESRITVFAPTAAAYEEAKETLDVLLQDREPTLEFGAIYSARVVELRASGVMVQLYDDMTPVLLHNSQLDITRVHHPSALGLEVGQSIKVKYFGRDPSSGQMRLSRRALQSANLITKTLHQSESSVPQKPSTPAQQVLPLSPSPPSADTPVNTELSPHASLSDESTQHSCA